MQVSTVLGVVIKQQREERAWTEGVAIWVAVLVVSSVGEQLSGTHVQQDMHQTIQSQQRSKFVHSFIQHETNMQACFMKVSSILRSKLKVLECITVPCHQVCMLCR